MNCIDAKELGFDEDSSRMSIAISERRLLITALTRVKSGVYELRLNRLTVHVDNVRIDDKSGRKIGKIKKIHSEIETKELTQGSSIVFDECHTFNQCT
ncbi:hypothetical protein [Photobacterium damselae]|uniref:hypothetical protein n=1 Tax=Photobacterium damselae TaxID=38293 RepID=UPI001EFE2F0C|nr:hypothetical protein [Photobacterium damselae]MCG9780407.1 hypothetical protein [Photobacterium damselae]